MQLLKTLIDRDKYGGPALTPSLHELYDGNLQFPAASGTPYVIANFVSTLDGVISFRLPGRSGGSAISGSNPADRFIMGLLRASADAVIVGARTVQDVDRHSLWSAEYSYPSSKALFDEYRTNTLEEKVSRSRRRLGQRQAGSVEGRFSNAGYSYCCDFNYRRTRPADEGRRKAVE